MEGLPCVAAEAIYSVVFIGIWDQFHLGQGLSPEHFLQCLPENQVVLPKYYFFVFAKKWPLENFGGRGAVATLAPPPPPTSLVCLWLCLKLFQWVLRETSWKEEPAATQQKSHSCIMDQLLLRIYFFLNKKIYINEKEMYQGHKSYKK